ncbi:MAG: hypothetical protein RLZZ164_934 [Actinomycetota bacterium]
MKHFGESDQSGGFVDPQAPITVSTPLARELSETTSRLAKVRALDFPKPKKTRIIAVSNQKGGVGKTTSVVNLASALAIKGARVLVIDLDPQGNASTALNLEHHGNVVSIYDVLRGDKPLEEVIQQSSESENLIGIPATIALSRAEFELVSAVGREYRLKRALDYYISTAAIAPDYVLIDCPPSFGALTLNALSAANEVLIPIQCEYYALEGLSQLLENITLVKSMTNPELAISTILLTMYDTRTRLATGVAEDVRTHFPQVTLDTVIPRSVKVSEAPSYSQTVVTYDQSSPGAIAYLEAAGEIAIRGEKDGR